VIARLFWLALAWIRDLLGRLTGGVRVVAVRDDGTGAVTGHCWERWG